MAVPKVSEADIRNALNYIDKNGVPDKHKSKRHMLLGAEEKTYPPKYVLAVANHLPNNVEISTEGFNAIEAKNFLTGKGFKVVGNQEKYELVITSDTVSSDDDCFSMNNLALGDYYVPLGVYFQTADGEKVTRSYRKGERRISNQTMAKLAMQLYESELKRLSVEEKENFPVCQYAPDSQMIRGIYPSVEEFRKYHNSIEYLIYTYDENRRFVIYCWNVFSTIIFVQECLKRFGQSGDKFVLTYREKTDKEDEPDVKIDRDAGPLTEKKFNGYLNPYSDMLIESKNIILRGAPGTGKTYLARQIAADIISDGYFSDYEMLTDEQKEQVEFVQFHPSYDYSDFVEGLRPKLNGDGSIGFELRDGIFKRFAEMARKNYENSQKAQNVIEKELSVQDAITNFLENVEFGVDTFKTITGNEFTIIGADEDHIDISIPGNPTVNRLRLNIEDIRRLLESGQKFTKVREVTAFLQKKFALQAYSYDFALYKEISAKKFPVRRKVIQPEKLKKFVFIIDEINRGEISKILGELFFAIDPGYRGPAGAVSTQYSNLHPDPSKKFYIPENVYIIGTMNDIDKSVDSFDFAMRRRFRFIEIKADDQLEMLDNLGNEELKMEAVHRMTALNREIVQTEDLNANYQIGAAYFLKLKTLSFDQLWTDHLQPLLQEYIQGMYDEESIMNRFAKAYGYNSKNEHDEAAEN